jgi:hypothetical protein
MHACDASNRCESVLAVAGAWSGAAVHACAQDLTRFPSSEIHATAVPGSVTTRASLPVWSLDYAWPAVRRQLCVWVVLAHQEICSDSAGATQRHMLCWASNSPVCRF